MADYNPLDLDDDAEGNVSHIAEHGLSKEDVENVLRNPKNWAGESSRSSGQPTVFGWTESGLHIVVVFEHVDDDPLTVFPITAYEVTPKRRKKR
jgi:uncharacterized DUF497 family protein